LKLLLDSNVLLWAVYSPEQLSAQMQQLIQDESNELFVSHASLWELLAKISRGRLLLAGTSIDNAVQRFTNLGVTYLPIELPHIVESARLPQHHNDPFDRIIIAQAIAFSLPVVASDRMFQQYAVEVIW
jgi:PIN domain nuclease of toxin-antitoxin system